MNWIHLLTMSKDMTGLSESWVINVALTSGGQFAWQTSGTDADDEGDEPIDTGSADFIAEYLLDNASDMEADLIEGLTRVADTNSGFIPLLKAVKVKSRKSE